jgi:hypothetical protein
MKLLRHGSGYFNPRTVEEIVCDVQSFTRTYADETPDEYITYYSVQAVMTSGRKVTLADLTDDHGPVDIDAVINGWITRIEEAS